MRKIKRDEFLKMNEPNKMILEKLKEMGFNEVYGQSSKGNIGSQKTIENNNGILLDEVEGTHYYKIKL